MSSDDEEEEEFEQFDREEEEEEHSAGNDSLFEQIVVCLLNYKKKLIEAKTNETEDTSILSEIEMGLRDDSRQLQGWIRIGTTDSIKNPVLLDCVKGVMGTVGDAASWPTDTRVRLRSKVVDLFETFPYLYSDEHLKIVEKNGP